MILRLVKTELRRLFVTPLALVLLAIAQFIIAWAFFTELETYGTLQAKLVASESRLGLTSLVVIPALLNGLNIAMFLIPLLTMRALSSELASQRFDLLLASRTTAGQIMTAKFITVTLVVSVFWTLLLIQVLTLEMGTDLDLGRVLLTWSFGLLITGLFTAAALWVSSISRHPVVAAMGAYALLLFLRLPGIDTQDSFIGWFSVTQHLHAAQQGLLNLSDLVFFILATALFLTAGWMSLIRQRSINDRWPARISLILVAIILALSAPLLKQYQLTLDVSHAQQNTVSAATADLLSQLDQPLSFTLYVTDSPLLKKQLQQLTSRYQRALPSLVQQTIDPSTQPEAARTLGITSRGEILVRYNGRQQLVKQLSETAINQTIRHLMQRDSGWILNLQSAEQFNLLDNGLYGASLLTKNLQARGYLLKNFNLSEHGRIPDNTRLIILGGDSLRLSPIETDAIRHYLNKGGNLLWLTDSDDPFETDTFPQLPDVALLPGVIVDDNAAKIKLSNPDNALVTRFNEHPVTRLISRFTLFPQAAALKIEDPKQWQLVLRLRTGALSWNETGTIEGELTRDPILFEQAGPLLVGALFESTEQNRQQKIAFFGDSDFLRNHVLGQGDNLQLSLNLVHWLTDALPGDSREQSFQPIDQVIELSDVQRAWFGTGFLFLIPIALLSAGFIIPWLRRRRS